MINRSDNFFILSMPGEEPQRYAESTNEEADAFLIYQPFQGEGLSQPVKRVPLSFPLKNSNVQIDDSRQVAVRRSEYLNTLDKLIAEIQSSKTLEKVVLSRLHRQEISTNYSAEKHFMALSQAFPLHFNHWIHWEGIGQWMGASPELLLEVKEGVVSTVSLAGTLPVAKGEWTNKEREEQESVSQFIREAFYAEGWTLEEEEGPFEFQSGNIRHLKSTFKASGGNEVKDLLNRLHPTPAVAGWPKEEALAAIQKYEPYDRGFYTGYWGLKTKEFERYIVNLRCFSIHADHIAFYMGGGVNKLSNPEREWEETEEKRMATYKYLNEA